MNRMGGSMGLMRRLRGLLTMGVAVSTLLVAGCNPTKFNKLPAAEVDQAQKAAAEKFGSETLTAWAKNEYPKVTVPADPKFKEGQDDEAKQKAADKAIEADAGDFQSMTFYEAQKSDPAKFVLYRFKAKFSKKDVVEVRVVYDTEGKLSGFWIKPWNDTLT